MPSLRTTQTTFQFQADREFPRHLAQPWKNVASTTEEVLNLSGLCRQQCIRESLTVVLIRMDQNSEWEGWDGGRGREIRKKQRDRARASATGRDTHTHTEKKHGYRGVIVASSHDPKQKPISSLGSARCSVSCHGFVLADFHHISFFFTPNPHSCPHPRAEARITMYRSPFFLSLPSPLLPTPYSVLHPPPLATPQSLVSGPEPSMSTFAMQASPN